MAIHPWSNEIDGAVLKILLIGRMKIAAFNLFLFFIPMKVPRNLFHK